MIIRRLRPVESMSFDDAKTFLADLQNRVRNLHVFIKEHYASRYEAWLEHSALHPLQRIALQKQINTLKEFS